MPKDKNVAAIQSKKDNKNYFMKNKWPLRLLSQAMESS